MSDQYQRPYLDSSVWIAWIKGEVKDGVDCKDVTNHILRHAQDGAYPIYISTLVLAEVHKRRHSAVLTATEDDDILDFFQHDWIKTVEVDRYTAEQANRLCRNTSIMPPGEKCLMPNDAIHVATAIRAKCDYILAWDGGILKMNHPDIKAEKPQKRGQLFMDIGNG